MTLIKLIYADYSILITAIFCHISGSQKLDDNSRECLTQPVLFQTIYSFSEKFLVNGLFSYVNQKRTVFSPTGETNITRASGLGRCGFIGSVYTIFRVEKELFNYSRFEIAGNAKDLYIVSFERELDETLLEFSSADA